MQRTGNNSPPPYLYVDLSCSSVFTRRQSSAARSHLFGEPALCFRSAAGSGRSQTTYRCRRAAIRRSGGSWRDEQTRRGGSPCVNLRRSRSRVWPLWLRPRRSTRYEECPTGESYFRVRAEAAAVAAVAAVAAAVGAPAAQCAARRQATKRIARAKLFAPSLS